MTSTRARSRRRRTVVAVVVTLGLVITALPGSATVVEASTHRAERAAQSACGPRLVTPSGVTNGRLEGSVPVVLVHGITSSADMWSDPTIGGGPTLAQVLADVPAPTSVFAFDYGDASIDWVTDQRIGPSLVDAIECVTELSGEKVVLVGHSMGGLAIQYALGQIDAAGTVAHVTTIGTPFQGSAVLSGTNVFVDDTGIGAVAGLFMAVCARYAQDAFEEGEDAGACELAGVPESPVGSALAVDSPEIAALPPWPTSARTFRVAGDMRLTVVPGVTVEAGDVAVAQGSALAGNVADSVPPMVLECDAGPLSVVDVTCFHSNLTRVPEVIARVASEIERTIVQPPPAGDGGEAGDGGGGQADVDAVREQFLDASYEIDCGGVGARSYELSDGEYQDESVWIRLIEQFPGTTEAGQADNIVLISCQFGAGNIRDFLFAFQRTDGGWEQRGEPLEAALIIPGGGDTIRFESFEPAPQPGDPNCCPTGYAASDWEPDLSSPDVWVNQNGARGPLVITADDLPPDPYAPRFG